MTPKYVKLAEQTNDLTSPPYALYRYQENGQPDQDVRKCVPLLFIPGNRGGYRQGRTIGSRLERTSKGRGVCFTIYTVHFQDELSVLSEDVLEKQVSWLRQCLSIIMAAHKMDSLVLIGHSMGGILARMLGKESAVSNIENLLLITLATPHFPAVNIDRRMVNSLYPSLDAIPKEDKNHFYLSISGGQADIQVPANLANWAGQVNISTEDLRSVWASPDHQAIVWEAGFIRVLVDFLENAFSGSRRQLHDRATLIRLIEVMTGSVVKT